MLLWLFAKVLLISTYDSYNVGYRASQILNNPIEQYNILLAYVRHLVSINPKPRPNLPS